LTISQNLTTVNSGSCVVFMVVEDYL